MVSTGNLWRDTQFPPMADAVREAHVQRHGEQSSQRVAIRQVVDILTAVFSGLGLMVIVDRFGGDTLCLRLGPDLVGEFDRIDGTSSAFALKRLRQDSEEGAIPCSCGKSVLWRRSDLLDADSAILALIRS